MRFRDREALVGVAATLDDEVVMRALYDEHAGPVLGYVLRLTGGDRQRAEDVVQETMLRAWRHPEAALPAKGSLRPWLLTVRATSSSTMRGPARHDRTRWASRR